MNTPRALPIRSVPVLVLAAILFNPSTVEARPFQTGAYDTLTDNRFEVTNFNPEPFTGLVLQNPTTTWAVNPYASTVLRFELGSTPPTLIVPTGLNPVSIGLWTDSASVLKLVVACTGTHGLFLHSTSTGEVLNFLKLNSEPADLLIDQDNNRAFVSCQGTNTVVQVNLSTFSIAHTYALTCGSRAGSLFLDRGATAADHRVYVTPAITGNNSVPLPAKPSIGSASTTAMVSNGFIVDLSASPGPLPDQDVFRIDPGAMTIAPILRGCGSLIFDVDRNPDGNALWILSTNSLNKNLDPLHDPDNDTEPELRGNFAINQLVTIPGVTTATNLDDILPAAYAVKDLDDVGVPYLSSRSVNQARTVVFMGGVGNDRGDAFVASAQSDVILRLDKNGARLADLALPPHSQCYDLAKISGQPFLAALCLGTMTVEVFNLTTGLRMPGLSRSLGLDPTPPQIRRGRDVFLDGQLSKDARFSCASCHPRGQTDLLSWSLRGHPTDEKDIMLTQSLFSIAETFPHHWRGERDLKDFQKAFDGLLGANPDQPTDTQMTDLIAFFQSLQAPANPSENLRRILDDSRGSTTLPSGMPGLFSDFTGITAGSAVAGQDVFTDTESFNKKTCAQCHSLETGSDSSHMTEGFFLRAPRSMPIEMAHLRQLQIRSKDAEAVQIKLPGLPAFPRTANRNGFGFLHDGREPTLFHFLTNNFFPLTLQERVNAFRFTEQFDQGIAPGAHWGQFYIMPPNHVLPIGIETDIKEILIDGAAQGWNDVVAFGVSDPDDAGTAFGMIPMHWFWDRSLSPAKFVSDMLGVTPLTWAQMKTKTRNGFARNVFFGVPPGNGRRVGVDQDNDGLINGQEIPSGSGGTGTDPWNPNTDGASGVDTWPDKYELDNSESPLIPQASLTDNVPPTLLSGTFSFATSRVAKYHVKFSEDVKYTVTYQTTGGPLHTFTRDDFVHEDTFVLTHEEPSTPDMPDQGITAKTNAFTVTIAFRDRKMAQVSAPPVTQTLSSFNADVVHFPDFSAVAQAPEEGVNLHVSSLTLNPAPLVIGTDTLRINVKIRVDYNYNGPTYDQMDAIDRMVFGSLAWRHSVNDPWIKVGRTAGPLTNVTFSTSHPTSFQLQRPNLAFPNDTPPYEVAPADPAFPGDWVCSPHTGVQNALEPEETTITFEVHGLAHNDEIKYSVMGVLTPEAANTPGIYKEESLQEMQPLNLEDSMEIKATFP